MFTVKFNHKKNKKIKYIFFEVAECIWSIYFLQNRVENLFGKMIVNDEKSFRK